MSTITKMALAVLAGLLVGGGALAVADNGADDGLETMTVTTTTEQPGDVSGPCDEAEHANDPRCDGTQHLRTAPEAMTQKATTSAARALESPARDNPGAGTPAMSRTTTTRARRAAVGRGGSP